MSMKKLVEAECGGANALVGLSSHFIQDRAFKDEGFHTFSDSISANADQLAHEFIEETTHTTQPFRMDTLLAEMRELESRTAPVISPSVSQLTAEGDVQEWAQQYIDSGKNFMVNTRDSSEIWTADIDGIECDESSSSLGFGPRWADEYIQRTQESMLDEPPALADLSNSEEYEEKQDALAEAAGEVVRQTLQDQQRFTFSKFMKFMKQINEREITIDATGKIVRNTEGTPESTLTAEHWSLEYDHNHPLRVQTTIEEMEKYDQKVQPVQENTQGPCRKMTPIQLTEDFCKMKEYLKQKEAVLETVQKTEPFDKQLWEKLTEQWKLMVTSNSLEAAQWQSEYFDQLCQQHLGGISKTDEHSNLNHDQLQYGNNIATVDSPEAAQWQTEYIGHQSQHPGLSQYSFTNHNPLENISNPLEEGRRMLQAGNLPGAVLCFEAATKQEPENPLAWQLLGITQAENEKDLSAIPALVQCLKLEPDNLTALMALSACYTNENYQNQACNALKDWLRMNPKYSDILPETNTEKLIQLNVSSFLTTETYNEIKDAYLVAARRNPQDLDPDVQCGLGILFNIACESNLAVDCFKAALQVRPNDAALWNRLGATLANGDRSEEAVDAYRSALQLQPGFIRARYNLGITCVHLRAYPEAAEHFLTALKQQANVYQELDNRRNAMSDTIWNTLRLVMNLIERKDLVAEVYMRNLDKLTKEFGID